MFKKATRADLVGHTAEQIRKILNEAYQLIIPRDNFGSECLTTIIKLMSETKTK